MNTIMEEIQKRAGISYGKFTLIIEDISDILTEEGKLVVVSGNPKSGKSAYITLMANKDPNGVFLGRNNDEKGGFKQQSRGVQLNDKAGFIYIRDNLPSVEDIKKQYPKAKNIYFDEAQNGSSVQKLIFELLKKDYNVYGAGAMHNWRGTEPLFDKADQIILINGGDSNNDKKSKSIVHDREKYLYEIKQKYKSKVKIVGSFEQKFRRSKEGGPEWNLKKK